MTKRERVLCVLSGQTPDKVPWCGDLAYWLPYAKEQGWLAGYQGSDGLFRLHRDLGVGFYLQGYFPFEWERVGCEVRQTHAGHERLMEIITPVGTLREVTVALPKSYTNAISEHMIKSPGDLKILMWMYERMRVTPAYDEAIRRTSLIGEDGITLVYQMKSPFMELTALLMGIEQLTYALMDDTDLVEAALELMEEVHDKAAEITLSCPCDAIMIPENLSSEVVGKAYFGKYVAPYQSKWNARIKASGKYSFVHMDGTMKGLIRECSNTGFSVMEALTPAPVGDIRLNDIAQYLPDGTVIWGGLPGVYFTDLVNDAQFDAYVIDALKIMKTAPRYVLGVADQVPPGARMERIARVNQLVEKYGVSIHAPAKGR